MKGYRTISALLAAAFLATGLAFLLVPDRVVAMFNLWSAPLGLPDAPAKGGELWLALASAYMYVVTLIALAMARRPDEWRLPWLLAHAKTASAVVSVLLFVRVRYLALAVNAAVDLALGLLAVALYRRSRG